MDDLWDEITIHIQGKAYSLGNTDKEKRVIIQYVMTKKQLALLKAFKEKDLDINIRSQTIDVKINETLSEERIQKVLKTVLEIIGKFISKFDVKKEEVGRRVPLCRESNGDEIGMSGAQAPRIPNHRQAQVPVLASREGNHFFDPDPDNVCIFTVQEKRKTSSKKWLIPIAIGIGTAIAAPIVIPAAVGALGFGSGGIVGGSIAASMMSAAAVANGGGVAAGGLIATLQSIGATGAISAGTALLSGTATGAVSGVIVAATKQRRGQKVD